MNDPFVGFSQSPKLNPEGKTRKLSFEIELDRPIKDALASFCSREGFESIFGKTQKFDFRQGAKLSFSMGDKEFRGTVSQINIPKRIVVNTEIHGEIEAQFKSRGHKTQIMILARSYLTDQELSDWEMLIGELEQSLRVI